MEYSGYLIVIEGIDGAGKTTLADGLANELSGRGAEVVLSHEPTKNSEAGRKIRELAAHGRAGVTVEQETELFVEDRRQHLTELVMPALESGKVVILDRYYFSTMAYQGARGADKAAILEQHKSFAPSPDLLVVLDLSVAEGLGRVTQGRGEVPNHFEKRDYLEKVAPTFQEIEHPNLLRLDSRQSPRALLEAVLEHLPQRVVNPT